MNVQILLAIPNEPSLRLVHSMLDETVNLIFFGIKAAEVHNSKDLLERIDTGLDDVLLLDWEMAEAETPQLVREILTHNPRMRIIALLPSHLRQYRELVWEAGACSSMPKEHMDQEWLSSALCIMHRAMEREAKVVAGKLLPPAVLTR